MIGRFSQLGVYSELVRSTDFVRTLFAGALALASYFHDLQNGAGTWIGVGLALLSIVINGLPIIWGAVTGILRRRVNVDELVSLALIACLAQGEFLTAAVVSFVMTLGSLIEQATSDSARKAIQALIDISPRTATIIVDGHPVTRSIGEVEVGNLLLVKPGDRIPVDAVVKKGASAVDESSMTGEPIPNDKKAGDSVYAGTLNLNGVMEIEASRVGEDTTLGRVIRLVAEAEAHKPEAVKLMDRYARWFTPAIMACAAVAWVLTGEVGRAIAVLIVGCPCALILAAPTAIVATLGRAARSGVLVKGGQYLEEAGRANVILFDKTGTLTEGKPRVNEVVAVQGVAPHEVLTLAACAEQNNTHPLARAVLKAAHYARVTIHQAEEMFNRIGFGVEARVRGSLVEVGSGCIAGGAMSIPVELSESLESIKERGATPLLVYRDHRPLGVIGVADKIRPSAKQTVDTLCSMGMKHVGILSGDHEKSACMVADTLGLTKAWSEMKPQDKLRVIKDFQESGNTVIFVGDGINDAPALAAANVSIAMGAAGTDVALETADIALMNDNISKIPFLLRLSRRMLKLIKFNIAFGLLFNLAAVLASGTGFLTPIMGALVHNIGSVLVVLSSASMAFASEEPLPAQSPSNPGESPIRP
jgi:Cd2+/Zn2+-exporting ATPase